MKLFNIDWDAVDKEEARLKKKWRKERSNDIVAFIVFAPAIAFFFFMVISLLLMGLG